MCETGRRYQPVSTSAWTFSMSAARDSGTRASGLDEDLAIDRAAVLQRVVPTNLIPLATANGMLVLGTNKKSGPNQDCFFPLPEYLTWAGTISLSMVIVGVVGTYIVGWISKKAKASQGERRILRSAEYLSRSLVVFETVVLLSGSIFIFPNLSAWQHEHKHLPNYCDFGIVTFASVFISLALAFIFFGVVCLVILMCFGTPVAERARTAAA